jgi:hypothetical protein
VVYVATSAASTTEDQFFGAGLAVRWDRDRWDRRAGFALGLELEIDHGVTAGSPVGGTIAATPLFAAYVVPGRLAVVTAPALVRLGTVGAPGFGADVAGRAGLALDVGRVELAVDSPVLSYVTPARWHGLPFSVRLGLLFD